MAFLSSQELKLYLIGIFSVTLLAILGVILYALFFAPSHETSVTAHPQPGARDEFNFSISDFYVPESYRRLQEPTWVPLRERRPFWTAEEIEKYWIDPIIIIEDRLDKESKQVIDDFFSEIP